MSKRETGNLMSPGSAIIKDLCWNLCKGLPEDDIKRIYKSAIIKISDLDSTGASNSSLTENDETVLCRKIEKQLRSLNKADLIPRFYQFHRKLRSSESQSLLTNRNAVLQFLLRLSEGRNVRKIQEPIIQRKIQLRGKSSMSSNTKGANDYLTERTISNEVIPNESITVRPTSFTSHFNSKRGSPINLENSNDSYKFRHSKRTPVTTNSLSLTSTSPHYSKKCSKLYASEMTVLSELVYCFQGVEGNVLKKDLQHGFVIDPQVKIRQAPVIERLTELGYLHNRVCHMCSKLIKGGSVAQAVEAAIRKQLTDYYGMVGSIHSELNQANDENDDTPMRDEVSEGRGPITLRRLLLWASEPMQTLKILCDALLFIMDARGGAVISALDRLRHHGDPRYQKVCKMLLAYGGKPLMNMMKTWMVEGELFDPYDEFFIAVNTSCQDRDIWQDKFVLRTSLIPNVMTHKQADMILRSGKAIHFLNVICDQRVSVTGMRKKLQDMKEIDLLEISDPRSELAIIVAAIFEETSKLVLETLVNKFKLFQHFQGLRRYILLGQGDFANYFMELIEPEMRKPASRLQYHELMGLLGSAIRSSTAAYEDPEIMKRVSVKLLVASGGDWGSDVFGLQYIMHDPLDAAFGLSDGAYSHMFNFLWRTKRMEYILLSLRKERWATKNKLNILSDEVPDVNPVLVLADRLSQELVHFARQFHYYILFEVVECLWEKFTLALRKATSLDDVISAHSIFIRDIQAQTFQDEASRKFINELRLIWDLVFELEVLERRFLNRIDTEVDDKEEREKKLMVEGTNFEEEACYLEKCKDFKAFLSSTRAQYSIIIRNYQEVLKKFLLELSIRKDHQLRMLSARIDYNEHYKKSDVRILDSMKFSRCSDLFD